MRDDQTHSDQDLPHGNHRLDARSLRGIAHPLRVRVLSLLRLDGPSTATRLAERLGLNSGATSYHLRQLAAYGFVTEEPGRGAGRERWWRAVHRGTEFHSDDVLPHEPELAEAYLHAVAALYAEGMRAAVAEWATLPEDWRRSCTLTDEQLLLTPEETARLVAELREVVERYRLDVSEQSEGAPAGAEPVSVQFQVFRRPGTPQPGGDA